MKKMFLLGFVSTITACGSGTTIGTGADEDRPQTVIEVVEGDSGTGDAGTAQNDAATGDDSGGATSGKDASTDSGSVQDSGTVVAEAGSDAAQDSGPVSQQDSRVVGTWVSGNGSEVFVFSPQLNGYFFQQVNYVGGTRAEENDGIVTIQNSDAMTFTTNASSCKEFESQPAPYQMVYSFSTDGSELTLTDLNTHAATVLTIDSSNPSWETGCQLDGWGAEPVSSY